jgi:hypothetical protein
MAGSLENGVEWDDLLRPTPLFDTKTRPVTESLTM